MTHWINVAGISSPASLWRPAACTSDKSQPSIPLSIPWLSFDNYSQVHGEVYAVLWICVKEQAVLRIMNVIRSALDHHSGTLNVSPSNSGIRFETIVASLGESTIFLSGRE